MQGGDTTVDGTMGVRGHRPRERQGKGIGFYSRAHSLCGSLGLLVCALLPNLPSASFVS